MKKFLFSLGMLFIGATLGFTQELEGSRFGQNGAEIPSLREVFASQFIVGVALEPHVLRSPDNAAHVRRQFGSLTAENCMKPDAFYRKDPKEAFVPADQLVAFARKNGMKLRGHTLVWHGQTPPEFFTDDAGNRLSPDALYARMEAYMTCVVGHFRGTVFCWDVVNEALADSGPETYRTRSPWYEICGKDFIRRAFETAHRIDPDARLYYNDYGLVDPAKRVRCVEMLKELLAKGVPIHGVGMQAHWNPDTFDPAELQKSIDAFAELGLDVQITELDMNARGPYTAALEAKLADAYHRAFEVLCHNADKISTVTFWGISDQYSWLNFFPRRNASDCHPLLFDRSLRPKKAFDSVVDVDKK